MTETITVARFNNLQSRIALTLGNGAGSNGYGQPVSSSQIANVNNPVIRAEDFNRIFLDLIKARIHQVGFNNYTSSNLRIARVLQNTSSIGLDSSPNVVVDSETGAVSLVDDVQGSENISSFRGISDYERLMSQIEIDRFLADSSQMSVVAGTQSVRTTPWNKSLFFEFIVNFANSDHRRHFFNAGGKIFINSSLLNTANLKSQDWAAFLSLVGTISFNHTETSGPHSGAGSLVGNYDLTPNYGDPIYQFAGSGTVYGVYNGNSFRVFAKEISPSAIAFKVEYNDSAQDFVNEDLVQGRLECTITHLLPDGGFDLDGQELSSVALDSPTYSTLVGLDSFAAPTQIFSLTSNKQSVTANESFRITLSTLNIPDTTPIPYTIDGGVGPGDISNEPLTGTFIVNKNASTKTFTASPSLVGNKTFRLSLNDLPNAVSVTLNQIQIPTSTDRTCISVIDESSQSASTIRTSWLNFRSRWPNRPFFLLQPGRSKPELKIPAEFNTDPLAKYFNVNRDNGSNALRSDWYALCNLSSLPDGSKIAIFIDSSGSLGLDNVRASYNFLIQQLSARNMDVITVSNKNENWILPFDQILN